MDERWKKAGRFLVFFFAIFFGLSALISWMDLSALEGYLAAFSGGVLGLPVSGNIVSVNGYPFAITNECTGLVSAAVLCAVVLSLRKPDFKTKTVLFLIGALVVFLLNIPRVMLVLYSAQIAGAEAAEVVPVATWFSTTLLILGLWIWTTRLVGKIRDFSEL